MNTNNDLNAEKKLLKNGFDEVIYLSDDFYDKALIGVSSDNRAIYNYDIMVDCLAEKFSLSYDEAIEWIDYNVIGSCYGEKMPIIMFPLYE